MKTDVLIITQTKAGDFRRLTYPWNPRKTLHMSVPNFVQIGAVPKGNCQFYWVKFTKVKFSLDF